MQNFETIPGFEQLETLAVAFIAVDPMSFLITSANRSARDLLGDPFPKDLGSLCHKSEKMRLMGQAVSATLSSGKWIGELLVGPFPSQTEEAINPLTQLFSTLKLPVGMKNCTSSIEMLHDATGREFFLLSLLNSSGAKAREEVGRRIAQISERTHSLALLCDALGRVIWVNASYLRQTGKDSGSCIGRQALDLLGERADADQLKRLAFAFSHGRPFSETIPAQAQDGSPWEALIEISPTQDSSGQIDGFVCVGLDVSETCVLHERLRQHAEAIEQLARIEFISSLTFEQRTQSIFDWLRDFAGFTASVLYVRDLRGQYVIQYCGPKELAQQLAHCECTLVQASPDGPFEIAYPVGSTCPLTKRLSLCAPVIPHSDVWGVLCSSSLDVHNEPEWLKAALGLASKALARDLSETDRVEGLERLVEARSQELQQANSQLSGALSDLQEAQEEISRQERISAFASAASGFARDLSQPMAGVIMAAPVLKAQAQMLRTALRDGSLDPDILADIVLSLEESSDALTTAGHTVQHLLGSFDKGESFATDEFDAIACVRQASSFMIDEIQKEGKKFHIDLPASVFCLGSRRGFLRICKELCANALTHGMNQPDAYFSLTGSCSKGRLVLLFSDNGPGISEERRRHLFEAVYGSDTNERELGLASCWILAQRMGATLSLLPEASSGSCFELSLPLTGSSKFK